TRRLFGREPDEAIKNDFVPYRHSVDCGVGLVVWSNSDQPEPGAQIFMPSTCTVERPHEILWNVLLVDKIEAQVVGFFDKTPCQNVLRAPNYFFRDCLEQILRNANGHLLAFRKSG